MARRKTKSTHHREKHKRYENNGVRLTNKVRNVTQDWKRSRAYKEKDVECPQALIDSIRA